MDSHLVQSFRLTKMYLKLKKKSNLMNPFSYTFETSSVRQEAFIYKLLQEQALYQSIHWKYYGISTDMASCLLNPLNS